MSVVISLGMPHNNTAVSSAHVIILFIHSYTGKERRRKMRRGKRKRRNRTYRKMMEGTNWEDVSLVYKDEGEL